MKKIVLAILLCISSGAIADWATAPKLESIILWGMVADENAEVVSSVAYGSPNKRHSKQTVFKILKASKSEGAIKWAINSDGSYRPVMCTESWEDWLTYRGSSCAIPGCIPDNKQCISDITKNL